MPNNVTLTIGIPTYNGLTFIIDALDSIVSQITEELRDKIEIVVSDNASTDGTGELVKAYQAKHSANIQYFRNDANVGFDRNVDLLFKRGSGQFVWMMGDDDTLKPHAIHHVLKLIEQHPELHLLQVNFDQFDRALTTLIHQELMPSSMYCTSAEAFLVNAHNRYALFSSLIIRREAWNAIDVSGGFGSLFMHVYAMYRILPKGPSFIESEPLVNFRMYSASSHADGDTLLSVALASEALANPLMSMGAYKNISRKFVSDARKYTNSTITIAKLKGISDRATVARKLTSMRNPLIVWLRWFPVIFCPDPLFNFLYSSKKSISSKTRPIEHKLKAWLMKKPS